MLFVMGNKRTIDVGKEEQKRNSLDRYAFLLLLCSFPLVREKEVAKSSPREEVDLGIGEVGDRELEQAE